jgi:transposase
MIEALIAGETNAAVMANMALGKMRPKIPALTDALVGSFGAHHGAVASAILRHIDFIDETIATLDGEIESRLEPFRGVVEQLQTIPGVGRRTVQVMIAEFGTDMSRWPTERHFAAWAGVAPANKESAGKRHPVGARYGDPHLRRALTEAAKAGVRTKNTYLGAQYAQIRQRRGPNKATVAVAHSILVSAYHMIQTGETYDDLGADYFSKRRSPEAETKRLVKRLQALGHEVTLTPAA